MSIVAQLRVQLEFDRSGQPPAWLAADAGPPRVWNEFFCWCTFFMNGKKRVWLSFRSVDHTRKQVFQTWRRKDNIFLRTGTMSAVKLSSLLVLLYAPYVSIPPSHPTTSFFVFDKCCVREGLGQGSWFCRGPDRSDVPPFGGKRILLSHSRVRFSAFEVLKIGARSGTFPNSNNYHSNHNHNSTLVDSLPPSGTTPRPAHTGSSQPRADSWDVSSNKIPYHHNQLSQK